MNVVTDTWRQLVRRRLWPVALLLVGALVAVPMLLAKDPEPVPAPSPVPGAAKATTAAADTDPLVTMASAEEARRRRVLGASKDPFEPAPLDVKKEATPTPAPDAETEVSTGGSEPGGGSGGSSSPESSVPSFPEPAATPTPAPKPTYPLYTLTVRFGASDGELTRTHLKKLDPLPDAEAPVLVYLGVKQGGKVAVFLVDDGVVAQGDGKCDDPENCETLEMRVGDTEFFDVPGEGDGESTAAQYQLDLVGIKTKKTADASKARAQFAKTSKQAKKAARARVAKRAGLAMAGGFDIDR